jgi:hypothetical protein
MSTGRDKLVTAIVVSSAILGVKPTTQAFHSMARAFQAQNVIDLG